LPTKEGLDQLHVSASGQLSEQNIRSLRASMSPGIKLILVDLRREQHGLLNGEPISWLGEGKKKNEQETIACLNGKRELVVHDRNGQVYTISKLNLKTEADVAHNLGIETKRFPCKDHTPPPEDVIDQFVTFVEGLDSNTWVHLHCHEGAGRATTFMIMFDMLHHANKISKSEIMRRQYFLGGVDIAGYDRYANFNNFLDQFYQFARMRSQDKSLSWSRYTQLN